MAAVAGSAAGASPIADLLGAANAQQPGAGADAMRAQLESLMGSIRDIDQQVQALTADFPTLAQPAQQIRTLLKQMVVQAAQQAPQQTASGAAVPGGGMA